MLNLMSWLLVLFAKEQGKRVRTLGVRGNESTLGKATSSGNGAVLQPQLWRKASSLHVTRFEDAVQQGFQKAKLQVSNRWVNLSDALCTNWYKGLLSQSQFRCKYVCDQVRV